VLTGFAGFADTHMKMFRVFTVKELVGEPMEQDNEEEEGNA
jgi:hypothetical protein